MVKAAEHNRPLVSDGFTARKPVKPEVDDRRHDEHDENPTAADDQRHEQTKVMHRRDLQHPLYKICCMRGPNPWL